MDMQKATKEEFDALIASYPNKLEIDVCAISFPETISYNDFSRGRWPASVVASKYEIYTADYKPTGQFKYRIASDVAARPSPPREKQ